MRPRTAQKSPAQSITRDLITLLVVSPRGCDPRHGWNSLQLHDFSCAPGRASQNLFGRAIRSRTHPPVQAAPRRGPRSRCDRFSAQRPDTREQHHSSVFIWAVRAQLAYGGSRCFAVSRLFASQFEAAWSAYCPSPDTATQPSGIIKLLRWHTARDVLARQTYRGRRCWRLLDRPFPSL